MDALPFSPPRVWRAIRDEEERRRAAAPSGRVAVAGGVK